MLRRTYEEVREYLQDNLNEALDLARQLNFEDGSFEWTETYDWDDLCYMAAKKGKEGVNDLVRAAVEGDTYGGQVRYDAYGNLESGEEGDLLQDAYDYLTDILNVFNEYVNYEGYVDPCLDISDELQDVIDESMNLTIKVTDIEYDLDEEDKTPEVLNTLKKELIVVINTCLDEDAVDLDVEIADAITDETGWCVCGFKYEVIKKE